MSGKAKPWAGDSEGTWGFWGQEPPCAHLKALRRFIENSPLEVYSEHGEQPAGWVNIHCRKCHRTYETVLCSDRDGDGEDA
jgi:hypothetical protein